MTLSVKSSNGMKVAMISYIRIQHKEGKMKKVAVVTGAGAGIGKKIALQLAGEGYRVYANARSEKKLEDTLAAGKGYDIIPLIFDVKDLDAIEESFSHIDTIDCLVNNAGVSIRNKGIYDINEDDWDMILDTNAKGYFFVARAALKKMKRGGCIINMSSGAAKTGGDFVSIPYSTSKGAINSLTVCLARELASEGIRVNAVSPGFIDTDMLTLNGQPKDFYSKVIPLGRLGETEDIANMVAFLASEKAGFVTGQIIEVNGGDIMG